MAKISSLSSRGIKYKLFVALCLMSIIPVLVLLNYIFPSLFPSFISRINLVIIIPLIFFIVALGFILIERTLDPVVSLSENARLIAAGDIERRIEIESEDEIGQLGESLNQLTLKIKENMDELKNYGAKTEQANLEIQKRIIIISGLLQISELISQGSKLDDILDLCVEKVKGLADSSLGFILFLEDGYFKIKAQEGLNAQAPEIFFSQTNECLTQLFKSRSVTVIDAKNPCPSCQGFLSELGIKNSLCLPVFSRHKPIALMGIGNGLSDFIYSRDEQELLDIFGKQVTIAVENNLLIRTVEKLEIMDTLTGLYNEQYIRNRLDEEIKRAIIYQRPCGLILSKINGFRAYQELHGQIASEAALKKIASCLSSAFSGVERLARFGDYAFAIVLPEKNRRQIEKIAEELQKRVGGLFQDGTEVNKRLSLDVAVAENPLDGASSQELITFAQNSLLTG